MSALLQKEKGTWVLLSFIVFFTFIAGVNAIFIYSALSTHSGVVTKQPYEKGLAYNETLDKARNQPNIDYKTSYENGVLQWQLDGIENADVSVKFLRAVRGGYDFDTTLEHIGGGIYEARPDLPLRGQWTAKLKATWNNTEFQTTHDFIAR